MPSDKAAYLAAHYLTADTKPGKKRKRKQKEGLLIQDEDDVSSWATPSAAHQEDEDAVIAGTSAEFRRAKKSAWKRVGAPIPSDTKDARDAAAVVNNNDAESAAADAILASAEAENAARRAAEDDAPVVAGVTAHDGDNDDDDDDDDDDGIPMMSDGAKAGLQSAAALTKQQDRRRRQERKELARLNAERAAAGHGDGEEEQLVLRDATGRRVDVSMRRAEARRAAAEAEDQARQADEAKKRALRGDVQLEAVRRRREDLEDAALLPLARTKDDAHLNAELRAEARWNDPMAQFMDVDAPRAGAGKKMGVKGRRPVYKGAVPPNRYSIQPGYRWDGVDRGNGFEAQRFKALNRRQMNKNLEYSWQMDE